MAADPTDEREREAAGSADDRARLSDQEADDSDHAVIEDLRTQIELLETENRVLREARAHRHRTRHRRTAAGLAVVGLIAVAAALLFPGVRDVLFALGATGLFGAVLTYYLSPERFVAAGVGEAAHAAYADSIEDVVDELGLTDVRVYVPREVESDPVRLFLPQHADYVIPDEDVLASTFVVTDDPDERGVSLHPTGVPLFRELRRTLSGPLAEDPGPLADQLADGVVEAFELARRATTDVEDGRITVAVGGSAYGGLDRVDHPVTSLLAVGLAVGLNRTVTVEIAAAEDDRADHLVTCRWSTDDRSASSEG